jgi:hypothetical protein
MAQSAFPPPGFYPDVVRTALRVIRVFSLFPDSAHLLILQ